MRSRRRPKILLTALNVNVMERQIYGRGSQIISGVSEIIIQVLGCVDVAWPGFIVRTGPNCSCRAYGKLTGN